MASVSASAYDYGPAPSGQGEPEADADLAASRPPEVESSDGSSAVFRMAFAAMSVPGLPDRFSSGRVVITQTPGPIRTQTTHIVQRPGWVPQFDKTTHKGPVIVGDGLVLTVCHLPVTIPTGKHMSPYFEMWRDEVLAAIAVVAVLLDERIAQEEVLEDLIVLDSAGLEAVAMVDMSTRVRHFAPTKRVASAQHLGLRKLADGPNDAQTPSHVAARCYLRATGAGQRQTQSFTCGLPWRRWCPHKVAESPVTYAA